MTQRKWRRSSLSFGPRRWGRDLRREHPVEGVGRSHGGPDDHAEQPKWMGILMAPTKRVGHPEGLVRHAAKHKRAVYGALRHTWYSISGLVRAGRSLRGAAHITGRIGGCRLLDHVLWLEGLFWSRSFTKPQDVAKVAYEQAAT
jgi:hypothetical protein